MILNMYSGSSGSSGMSVPNNAGAHNSIFRGNDLGTSVTTDQYAMISAGTFDDLFVGDYWTINSTVYRIAAIDYYYQTYAVGYTKHHLVIVPDKHMYNAAMNSSNTTSGGYVGSVMYTTNLATAQSTIETDFGSSHLVSRYAYLCNTVDSSGNESAYTQVSGRIVDLMCERQVYGADRLRHATGTSLYTYDYCQFPLFALAKEFTSVSSSVYYWLRDVVSASGFAYVSAYGDAAWNNASNSRGVRPYFCIA